MIWVQLLRSSEYCSHNLCWWHGCDAIRDEGWQGLMMGYLLQVPRSGGIRRGWMQQFVVVCDFKLFLYDINPDRNNVPNVGVSQVIDMRWVGEITRCAWERDEREGAVCGRGGGVEKRLGSKGGNFEEMGLGAKQGSGETGGGRRMMMERVLWGKGRRLGKGWGEEREEGRGA